MHLNKKISRNTIFAGRITHGMLTASLISAINGEELSGHGTVYLAQSLRFMAAVRPDDILQAHAKVMAIDHAI